MNTTTYHNDETFKRRFVEQTVLHQEQDRYIAGTYAQGSNGDFKGCSVGCSLHSLKLMGDNIQTFNNHALLAEKLGWPEWLCRLQDAIFEGLPAEAREEWTPRLARAVPVGKDIERVKFQFCSFLMGENIERVNALDISDDLKKRVVDAIRQVQVLHDDAVKTGVVDESATESAESATRSAARSAMESAAWSAWSAAWSAARSAMESAAWSAWSAAWSAARSAMESAARSAAWSAWSAAHVRYADKLIELLESLAKNGGGE